MAGTVSPGQTLTPNPNVFAPVQMGGDTWGANGGGAVAVGGGATDQTGYVKPIASTMADGESATNYMPPGQIVRGAAFSILNRMSNAAGFTDPIGTNFVLATKLDSTIVPGGSNAG